MHAECEWVRWTRATKTEIGLRCENMEPDARRQEVFSLVGLCGNCDEHGGLVSRLEYEAVKQSRVETSRTWGPFSFKQHCDIARKRLRGMQLGAKRAVPENLAIGEGPERLEKACGQVAGAKKVS